MAMQSKKRAKKTVTAGCLFAGIGGFCFGLKSAKAKVLWANEEDDYANETYAQNHPGTRLIPKDVKKLSVEGDELAPVDILTAGFPCQSFSVAGDKKGFDDERGQLFFEIIRIIEEFGDKKPSVLLLENVPYLQSGKRGVWFAEVVKRIQSAGYWFSSENCKVLNTAKITSLPHRRERLFMVATAIGAFDCNEFNFPEPNGKAVPLGKLLDKRTKKDDVNYIDPANRYCKIIEEKMNAAKKAAFISCDAPMRASMSASARP